MKIRCALHLNGGVRRILLVGKEEERIEHIALRLSAAALFFQHEPALEVGPGHPALSGLEFTPDLMALDEAGGVGLWVECGNAAINKLAKAERRLRTARIVVLKGSPEEGKRLRETLRDEVPKGGRIEIWSWPHEEFLRWVRAIEEANSIVGEANGRSLNLVLNSAPFNVELVAC